MPQVLFPTSSLYEVSLNQLAPSIVKTCTLRSFTKHGDRLAKNLVVECDALTVVVEALRTAFVYAELLSNRHSINVCAEEKELPTELGFLMLNHGLNLVVAVLTAGVFHSVGRDDEQNLFSAIYLGSAHLDAADFAYRAADGIEQSRVAANEILFFADGADRFDVNAVVQHRIMVVEQHGGNAALTGLVLLLFYHGVEAADGVALKPAHRATAIKDKY